MSRVKSEEDVSSVSDMLSFKTHSILELWFKDLVVRRTTRQAPLRQESGLF